MNSLLSLVDMKAGVSSATEKFKFPKFVLTVNYSICFTAKNYFGVNLRFSETVRNSYELGEPHSNINFNKKLLLFYLFVYNLYCM